MQGKFSLNWIFKNKLNVQLSTQLEGRMFEVFACGVHSGIKEGGMEFLVYNQAPYLLLG